MKTLVCLLAILCSAAAPLKRLADDSGGTMAVTVPADSTVTHMPQVCGADTATLLSEANLPPDATVKLNVIATTLAGAAAAREAIRQHFPTDAQPAVSLVVGALPQPEATIAIDAMVATDAPQNRPHIFISGQAEKGGSAAEAIEKTLLGLDETLKFLGCTRKDIVQGRCFLTAMSAAPQATRAFRQMFGGENRLVFVEWKSTLPAEIEMIALGPAADENAPALEYLTPRGKTASPLFSRIARVNRGELIFIGDIYSKEAGSAEEQVLSIFQQLDDVLKQAGSDMRHLVKATYCVSDDEASKQLNVLRPRFYDPQRPPAASKAMVPAVGVPDRSISIDMIAVRVKP